MRGLLAAVCVGLIAIALSAETARGQAQPPLERGLHYYAIENLDQKQIVRRGTAGSNGVAFSNLVLAPNVRYRIWILQASTLRVARQEVTTPGPGQSVKIRAFLLRPASSLDADGDGLHDLGERIMGTDPKNKDSDNDGVLDGAEVKQGSDPLDGILARTGIVASVDSPGIAQDVCAQDDLVVVADGAFGVQVHNVFNRMAPRIIARIDTPGTATRVSCDRARIAVADGPAGVAVIDISDPPQAKITQQVSPLLLGGQATSVAVVDRFAYVGTDTGQLVTVDLLSGAVIQRLALPGGVVRDLALEGDFLYALTTSQLIALRVGAELQVVGTVNSDPASDTSNSRLSVGGGVAYSTHARGYNTFSLQNPAALVRLGLGNTPQFGWRQIVPTGSSLGVAIANTAPSPAALDGVSIFDVSDPQQTNVFVSQFVTPGEPRAVATFNDLAYCADGTRGLQVVSYRFPDTTGIAPTISLSTNFGLTAAEEGQLSRVTAAVTDNVAVRNVEWFLDGTKVSTDGNFPFEFRFTTPARTGGKTSFTLRARATDTGGNATLSATLTIQLLPDTTGPSVRLVAPLDGSVVSSETARSVIAFATEQVDPASVTPSTFTLVAAGPDGLFNTGDDVPATGGTISFRPAQQGVVLSFPNGLGTGLYRAQLTTGVKDLAGNALTAAETWSFSVYNPADDRDGDGVPDLLEAVLGLNPDDADSDNDGTPDGQEDFDNDGLVNAFEVTLNRDARNPDTDMNGIADGLEDLDQDLLTDAQELVLGTDVFNWDTDGDKFSDGEEVMEQSNPRLASSIPLFSAMGVVGLRNEGGVQSAAARIAIRNDGQLDSAASTASVKNTAAPQAIDGRVEGPSFSTRNDGTPP